MKSTFRLRGEQVFAVVMRLWDYGKVRYFGQANNGKTTFEALGQATIRPDHPLPLKPAPALAEMA